MKVDNGLLLFVMTMTMLMLVEVLYRNKMRVDRRNTLVPVHHYSSNLHCEI